MNWKEFLKSKNVSEEDMSTKSPQEAGALMSEWLETLNNKELKDQIVKMQSDLKDMGIQVAGLEQKQEVDEDEVNAVVKFITDNKSQIKDLYTGGHGVIKVDVKNLVDKAPAIITTGNASNAETAPVQYGRVPGFNFVNTFIQSLITNSSTNSPNYEYTEVSPKDGNYAFVAEGTVKPQLDFTMETRFAKTCKIAAWAKLTEESLKDIPRMNSLTREILAAKHDIFKQRAILTADGTGTAPLGMTQIGRAFNAGTMANQVRNPNMVDVINACVVDIATTHNYEDEMEYQAGIVMVNNVDYFLKFQAMKEDNDTRKSLYPGEQKRFGNITVIPTSEIPSGKILVCDAKTYNHINYVPYSVRIGWVNDDFIRNQFVILGESRFYAFVKNMDKQAYIYDDIATIETAIATV